MYLQLLDQFSRTVHASIDVTDTQVALHLRGDLVATFPRREVESWLRRPTGEIENGRVVLMAVPNGVALAVQDAIPLWPLHDAALDRLRAALKTAPAQRVSDDASTAVAENTDRPARANHTPRPRRAVPAQGTRPRI